MYWSYVETHPAHITLPHDIVDEAKELLAGLLLEFVGRRTSDRPLPVLSADECHILRSRLDSIKGMYRTLFIDMFW